MKTSLLFFFLVFFILTQHSDAQTEFKLVLGGQLGFKPSKFGKWINRSKPDELYFTLAATGVQAVGGCLIEIKQRDPFFIESGLLLRYGERHFRARYTYGPALENGAEERLTETSAALILPVRIGIRLGRLSCLSGFQVEPSLFHSSDMPKLNTFEAEAPGIRSGWQIGISYQFRRVSVCGLAGNYFSRVCKGMSIGEQSLELPNTLPTLDVTVQLKI